MNKQKRKQRLVHSREPSGRIQREARTTPVANAKRIRDEAVRTHAHAEYGCELGRLWLDDKISAGMYEAGKRWAVVASGAAAAMQGPSSNPKSLAIGESGTSHPVDPDSEEGTREAKRHAHAVDSLRKAGEALSGIQACGHRGVRAAIEAVCERNMAVEGYPELLDLKGGLAVLADHWHLTG